jgi:hypothetical protein
MVLRVLAIVGDQYLTRMVATAKAKHAQEKAAREQQQKDRMVSVFPSIASPVSSSTAASSSSKIAAVTSPAAAVAPSILYSSSVVSVAQRGIPILNVRWGTPHLNLEIAKAFSIGDEDDGHDDSTSSNRIESVVLDCVYPSVTFIDKLWSARCMCYLSIYAHSSRLPLFFCIVCIGGRGPCGEC